MRSTLMSFVVLSIAASFAGCADKAVCAAGAVQRCPCPGGDESTQTCRDDGKAWGICECDRVPAEPKHSDPAADVEAEIQRLHARDAAKRFAAEQRAADLQRQAEEAAVAAKQLAGTSAEKEAVERAVQLKAEADAAQREASAGGGGGAAIGGGKKGGKINDDPLGGIDL
jgi:hypothetical protein